MTYEVKKEGHIVRILNVKRFFSVVIISVCKTVSIVIFQDEN